MANTYREMTTLTEVTAFSGGSTANVANNALSALSSALQNANGQSLNGYSRCRLRFSGTFAAAPGANTALAIYALTGSFDGTTFETSGITPPPRSPIATIPLDSTNATQTRDSDEIDLPAGYFKLAVYNNGTGQQLNSGWSLTIQPVTDMGSTT